MRFTLVSSKQRNSTEPWGWQDVSPKARKLQVVPLKKVRPWDPVPLWEERDPTSSFGQHKGPVITWPTPPHDQPMSPTSSLVCKSFPKTLLAASDPAHTGRVAAQHSAKNGTFSIICTVLCCCTMREHPPWQQLFPFVADVTLHLTRSVWTRGNSTLTSTCSRSWMWGGGESIDSFSKGTLWAMLMPT